LVTTAAADPRYTGVDPQKSRRGPLVDSVRRMAAHKFCVGQTVQFRTKPFYVSAALGTFEVIRQMPERDGEFEYRIKNVTEPHERVARESELSVE
jgi:hypothetical protein